MSQSKVIAVYSYMLFFFQFMGLTYFSIGKSSFSTWYQKYRTLNFLSICVILICTVIILINEDNNESLVAFSKIYVAVAFVQIAGNCITALCAVVNSFLQSNVEEKLFRKIDKIDDLMKSTFLVEIPSKKCKLMSYLIIEVLFFIFRCAFRIAISVKAISYSTFLVYGFTVLIMKLFIIKYFVFLELLKYRVQMFANIIGNFQSSQDKIASTLQLKTVKRIHSLILDIVALINECCGLTLLLCFVVLFISQTNKTYILYLTIDNIYHEGLMIGEYC